MGKKDKHHKHGDGLAGTEARSDALPQLDSMQKKAAGRGASLTGEGGYARHVMMCVSSKCCDPKEGKASLKVVRRAQKRLNAAGVGVYVSEADCLLICRGGPIAVVYPEGTWYGEVTPLRMERIVEQHLLGGVPVAEYTFARNPLAVAGASGTAPD